MYELEVAGVRRVERLVHDIEEIRVQLAREGNVVPRAEPVEVHGRGDGRADVRLTSAIQTFMRGGRTLTKRPASCRPSPFGPTLTVRLLSLHSSSFHPSRKGVSPLSLQPLLSMFAAQRRESAPPAWLAAVGMRGTMLAHGA